MHKWTTTKQIVAFEMMLKEKKNIKCLDMYIQPEAKFNVDYCVTMKFENSKS